MIYSLVDNEYKRAVKGTLGMCPMCKQEVIPKCGEIKIHHWSHKVKCPHETEPMTEWHMSWQNEADRLGLNIHFYDWKKHIPDAIDFKRNRVFEFQHSPITKEEILDRCDYYEMKGFKTFWVFNYIEKYHNDNMEMTKCEDIYKFKHKWQKQYIQALFRWEYPYYGKIFLDISEPGIRVLDIKGYHDNGNGYGIIFRDMANIFQ